MAHSEYDGPWDESTTMFRPIDKPTYEAVMAVPNGAEIVLFVHDLHGMHYDCMQMSDTARRNMQKTLDEHNETAREEDQVRPDNTLAADFAMWIHPDDMSPEKRAAIAALMLSSGQS